MCGQLGLAGSISIGGEKAFQKLLIYNAVRGIDSTGAASVKRNLNKSEIEIVLAKEVGNPFNLFDVKRKSETDFGDVLSGTHRALLGHCRASTRGETNRQNAHPFYFETIVGTHNGTLDFQSHQKLDGYKKFGTDSECIFNEIEAYGIEAAVKKLSGAYALVWYDTKSNTMNFLRNKERPLFFAFDLKKECLFWSSEKCHLAAAMSEIPHEEKFLYELPVDEHYSWEIPAFNQAFGKAKMVRREGHQHVPFSHGQGCHSLNQRGSNSTTGGSSTNFAFQDKTTGFWKAWSVDQSKYQYATKEFGYYHDSVQQCWDSLFAYEKIERLKTNTFPSGINLGYIWQNSQWVKDFENTEVVSVNGRNVLTLVDKFKENKLEEALKNLKVSRVYKDQNRRVFFDTDMKKYILWEFMGVKAQPAWNKVVYDTCPEFVPFTDLDINANHAFKHQGKKKKKVISYRGFQGSLLVQKSFEKIMESGCMNCARKPQWGNLATFVSSKDFLCEHCSRDDTLVKSLSAYSKL